MTMAFIVSYFLCAEDGGGVIPEAALRVCQVPWKTLQGVRSRMLAIAAQSTPVTAHKCVCVSSGGAEGDVLTFDFLRAQWQPLQ